MAAIVDEAAAGVVGEVEDAAVLPVEAARHLGSVPRSLPPHPCPDSATEAAEVDLTVGKVTPEAAEAGMAVEEATAGEEADMAVADPEEAVGELAAAVEAGPSGSLMRVRPLRSTRA